jgi:purine-nucleoside phosphorylase
MSNINIINYNMEVLMPYNLEDYLQSSQYISKRLNVLPKTAVVLGSGLGGFANELENPVLMPYSDIPHFPRSTVQSHEGILYCGSIADKPCLVMSGRFHYYEGWSFEQAAYYVRIMKLLGVERLIITNAAGCINTSFAPGELMLVTDHINFSGLSPCRGENIASFGDRFFDMTDAYSHELRSAALKCVSRLNITLREGVYAYMTGPQFETPAEIRALKILGADAVGMSTVPEVIEAAHCGIKVLCVSCLTNYAAGISNSPITGKEVIAIAAQASVEFRAILKLIIAEI